MEMLHERTTLLNLPWEIRLQILEYLVHSPTPLSRITRVASISRLGHSSGFRKDDICYWRFETGGKLDLYPEILGVCRQLYAEASPILYANTLLISVALYSSFSPIDVLGHWKPEDLFDPLPDSGLPKLGKFANLAFNIYIDFSRADAQDQSNAITQLCSLLVRDRSTMFGGIIVDVVDGSNGTRYSNINYAHLWGNTLSGFRFLLCRELVVLGDTPSRVAKWLNDSMVIDTKTGRPQGPSIEDDELMFGPELILLGKGK